jgi:hypothetical protein
MSTTKGKPTGEENPFADLGGELETENPFADLGGELEVVEEVEKKSPDETGAPAPEVTAGSGKPSVEKPEFTGKEFAPAKTASEVEAEALSRVSEKAAPVVEAKATPVVQAEAKKKPEGLTVDEIIEKRFYPKKETIQVDPKDRDTFVKGLISIPANKRHKGGYIEGFHKKTNVDKRALRKFYDEVVETEKRIAQLEEELHPKPKVSEAPATSSAGVPEMGFQQPEVSLPEYTPAQQELTPLQQQIVQASQEPTQKINTAGIDIGMRNQQVFKPMVINLPEVTITAPNDPNKVKELADAYAFIGDYDKARDGYKELESLLKDLAEQELQDEDFKSRAPKNYIEQRQAPATQGIAYMEYKRGNKEESRRIYEILNNKNLIDFSPELTQVGGGDVLQPGAERTQVGAEMDALQALKSRETSPDTKAGEYIKSISKVLEDLTYIPQVQEMTTAAVEKIARTGEVYDKEGFLSAAFNGLVGTGELILAAASYTPSGAKFVIPFIQAQQSLPENLQFVLAPWHAAMQSAYGKEAMPEYLNNTAAVLDFLTLGVAIHSAPKVTKKVQSRIASMKAGEMMNRDIYTRIYMEEVLNDLTPAEREAMVKEMERKAKKDPNYAQKTIQTAEAVGNTIISTANDINEISAEPTESYSKKRVPKTTNDLTTGQMVEMNGERKRFGYNDKGEAILENVETGDQQVIAKVNEVKDLADLDITVEDMPNDSQVNKMIAEADETFIFASKNGKTYRIVRDKVNGDFVFEVTTNDNLVNTLDMIGNEKAAKERKLEIINEAYTQQGKPTVRSLNEPKTEAYEVPDGMIAFEAETINASGGKGQYLFYDKKGNARVITEAEYIRLKGLGKPIKGVAEVKPVEEGVGVEAEAAQPQQAPPALRDVESTAKTMDDFNTFKDAVAYNVKRTADIGIDESEANYGDAQNINEIKSDLEKAGIQVEKVSQSSMSDGNYASFDGEKIKVTDENIPLQVLLHEIGEKVVLDLDKAKQKIEHANNIFEAVTTYGASRGNDAFADNFYLYFLSPKTLKELSPNVYTELNKLIPQNIKDLGKSLMSKYGVTEQTLKYNKSKAVESLLSKEQTTPVSTETAPTEAKPTERAPQVGDTVELPPVREGFGNRKMVYTEEGWQQQVGNITTKVGTMAQEAAQNKFMEQFAEVKPEAEAPKVEVEAPKVEEPVVEEPVVEEPVVEEPVVEEPVVEEPVVEEPVVEEPVVEEPVVEEPVAEEAKPEPFSPQMKDAYKRQASDAFQGKAAAENFEYKDVTATVKKVEGKKQADVSMSDQSPDAAKVLESIVTKADESKVRLNVKAEPSQQPFYEKFGFKFEGNEGVREHTQKRVAQEKKQKVMSALDALENALLDLPGIKEVAPGAKKAGAPVTAADSVKFIMKGIRKAVEAGLTINEAIADVMVELKNSKYADILKTIAEKDLVSTIRKVATKEFEKTGLLPEEWGISKAMTDAERSYLGIGTADEITASQRRTLTQMQEAGQKIPVQRVLTFAKRVIQDRLTSSPEEQLAMGNAVFELRKQRVDLQNKIKVARENGNQAEVNRYANELEMVYSDSAIVLEALAVTRSELGRGLGIGKYLYQADFSVENMSREYEASTGKAPTMEMVEAFEKLENDYNVLQKEFEVIEAKKNKVKEETALDDIKEAIEREKNKPKPKEPTKPKTAEEKKISTTISNFAKRVEQQKIRRGDKFYSSVVPGGPEAWNLGVTAVATTLKAAAKTASAIENAIIKGKEAIMATDWYKSLNEQRQFESLNEFDTIMRDEFQRSSKNMASIDKAGRVKIPFEIVKEIVKEGVENADDLTQKLYDVLYDDLIAEKPDLSLQDIKDGWTEYGKTKNPSQDDLLIEIRRLKRSGKLERALEDAKEGKLPLRSGYQREKMDDYQRDLDKQIKELLKDFPEDQTQIDKKWASALTRIKTMLNNKIKELQNRKDDIEAGKPVRPIEKKQVILDDDALLLKEQLKNLKDTLKKLEGEDSADYKGKVKAALKTLDNAISEYERRTKEIKDTGTYSEKPSKPKVSSPEIDAKKQELTKAKQEYEDALNKSDIPRLRATRSAIKTLEKKIQDLEKELSTGDIGYKSRIPLIDSSNPLYKAAKERVKELQEERKRLREETGLAESYEREVFRNRMKNKLAELERRIQEKDFSKKEKKEMVFDEEMAQLEYEINEKKFEFEVMLEKARYESLDPGQKAFESIFSIFSLPKTLNASMDLSAVLRQGVILSLADPKLAFIGKPGERSAFAEMIKQAGSEKAAEQFEIAVRSDRVFPVAKESGLYFSEKNAKLTAVEENLIGRRLIKKAASFPAKYGFSIPFKIFEGSNRAYTAYLNKIRFDSFKNFYEAAINDGLRGAELEANLKAYATFLNNATGRGKFPEVGGVFSKTNIESALPILNALFFAPRFVQSRITNLFNAITLYGNPYYPMRVKVEAYKAMASYIGVATTTMIIAKNMGAEVEDDPTSSDFGKIKSGNTRYDLFAGHQQLVVLFMRCMYEAEKSAATGVTKKYREGYNAKDRTDAIEQFLRSKASPPAGIVYDYLKGEFYNRTPFEWAQVPQKLLTPLIIQDMINVYETEGMKGIAKTLPFTTFGVGTQTFEAPEYMKGMDDDVRKTYENLNYRPMGYNDATYYRPGSKKEQQLSEEQIKTINDNAYKIINNRLNKAVKGSGIVYVKEGYSINIKKADPDEFKRAMDTMYRAEYKKQKDRILGAGNYKNTPSK